MSDTPRTDAVKWTFWDHDSDGEEFERECVNAEFARGLERENAALREDKERLDWLETAEASEWCFNASCADCDGLTLKRMTRKAIDAARAALAGGEKL